MHAAIEAVGNGTVVSHAARATNIPVTSLRDYMYGRTIGKKRGPETLLTGIEEEELQDYLLIMQRYGHPLLLLQLRPLIARITKTRYTPFKDDIPGRSWIKWFQNRHPNLALQKLKGLETARAIGLCPEATDSFYNNLQDLYSQYNYTASHIWNTDETGVQVGQRGGAHVLTKKGSRGVYSVIPDEKEWLSVLACVNTT